MKKYLFKFKGLFLVTICLTAVCAVLDVYLAFILRRIVDVSISKDMQIFKNTLLISLAYLLINVSFNLVHKIIKALYLRKSLVALKKDIFSKILSKDMTNFTEENSAVYISTLTNDETILEEDYFNSIIQLTYYVISFIAALYSLIRLNYNLIIAIFIGGALMLIIPQLLGGKLSRSRNRYSENMGKFTSKLKDMFSGFEVIKGFNVTNKVVDDFNFINETTERSKYKFHIISYIAEMLSVLFGAILHISVMMVGVYLVIKGKITVGEMIAAIQLMNFIVSPLMQSVVTINKINSTKDIAYKMLQIMKSEEKETGREVKKGFKSKISFNNLSFSYVKEKHLLENITINFEKGKRYALIGESGSGKSTLLKLLLGYYEDYTGELNIDEHELRRVEPDSLYELICATQQNVYLFDGTIKDNITLFKDYSENQINDAVKLAQLEKLVASLPEGLNTYVGENGSNLSGGERQRISIARAIIKRTPIILMDEATSALDTETAALIEKSILSLKDSTLIVITHRLNEEILINYDEIIVVKEGKIAEQGNFYDLISRKTFLYNMLNINRGEEILSSAAPN